MSISKNLIELIEHYSREIQLEEENSEVVSIMVSNMFIKLMALCEQYDITPDSLWNHYCSHREYLANTKLVKLSKALEASAFGISTLLQIVGQAPNLEEAKSLIDGIVVKGGLHTSIVRMMMTWIPDPTKPKSESESYLLSRVIQVLPDTDLYTGDKTLDVYLSQLVELRQRAS